VAKQNWQGGELNSRRALRRLPRELFASGKSPWPTEKSRAYRLENQLQQDLSWAHVEKGACTPRSAPAQAESLIYFGPPNLTDTKECFVMFSSTTWHNHTPVHPTAEHRGCWSGADA